MAVTKCKECGGAVSTRAPVCPHCGAQTSVSRPSIVRTACLVLFCLALVMSVVGFVAWPHDVDRTNVEVCLGFLVVAGFFGFLWLVTKARLY